MTAQIDIVDSQDTSERPDLYIGLVCAAGTDLSEVKNQIKAQLSVVRYDYQEIKVSKLIGELLDVEQTDDEYKRMKRLMLAGDCIRQESENGSGVAGIIAADIRRVRKSETLPQTTAFVIDSLKNPSEIRLLDQIYGRNYYTISVFLPREDRLTNLQNKIAKGRHEPPEGEHKNLADVLIKEDEKGIGKKSQNVLDSFPKADFFVNATEEISSQIKRFVELVFQEPFATPTNDEHFMFIARAAALRSSDLSRQVGAVIVDPGKAIVSTGCNEVPYPGGGVYHEERLIGISDNRDYKKGHDPNYLEIQRTLIEIISVLKGSGHIKTEETDSEVADNLLHGRYKELMSNARIRNLIEFGRVVHAEMHALSQAALVGRSVSGSTLYCTTFPCHGCARHIIAAGIHDVVFIEPYPKSLTEQLYGEEIAISHSAPNMPSNGHLQNVRFRPFQGIAPTLYQRVFAYRDRKDQYGTIATWNPQEATPVGAIYGIERPSVEIAASSELATIVEKAKNIYHAKCGEIDNGG